MNKILVLGTFHMQAKNDRTNAQGTEKLDEFGSDITSVINAVAEFNPTKIAVEYTKAEQEQLDKAYNNFLNHGNNSDNEIDKIAFPLAQKLKHRKVYAIDWMERGAAERGCGDVYDYLQNRQPELAHEIDALEAAAVNLDNENLYDAFIRLNSDEEVKKSLAYYMNYARIGGDSYYGNGWLIWWYQRNLNIFTNIFSLMEGKDDERILLIIGAAHKGILEQFFNNSGALEIVDCMDYLRREQ